MCNRQAEAAAVRAAFISAPFGFLLNKHIDEAGHHSWDGMKLVSLATQQSQHSVTLGHFAPTGRPAISNDGKTILAISFYIPPRLLAQPHGALHGGEGRLLILKRDPKLEVDSSVPIDSLTQEPRVSSDGSVVTIRHYNRDVTVLMGSSH